MIVVASTMKKDEIRQIVENIEEISVKFVKIEGFNQFFETDVEADKAVDIVKKAIKADPIGKSLMVQVRSA